MAGFVIERQFFWAGALAIIFAGLVVYVEQLGFYFTDVDTFSLIATSRFHSFDEFMSIFTSPMMKGHLPNALFFRPFASLTWGVDELIWGMNPLGYHLTDLLIHLANSLLLFQLVRRTARFQAGVGNAPDGISRGDVEGLVAGGLFVIHPVAVETVSAIARRPDLLFGFFALLALNFALRFIRFESNRDRLAIAVCCVLGLASKDSAVIVLALVGAFGFCLRETGSFRERLLFCVRLCWVPLVAVVLYIGARTLVLGGLGGYETAFGIEFTSVVKTSSLVFLCAFTIPGQLDSCTPSAAPFTALVMVAFFVLSALRLLSDRTAPEVRRVAFGWFCVSLFFVLYLATRTVALTRTIYALIPFLCILLAWACVDSGALLRDFTKRSSGGVASTLSRLGLMGISFAIAGAMFLAALRGQYVDEWRAMGELTRDVVDAIDPLVASVPAGSTVYTVNLPFKASDPQPMLRDHPILDDYSLQGWVDLAHPKKQLSIVGLTRVRMQLNDPAELSSRVSFDPVTAKLFTDVAASGRVEAFLKKRKWGKEHPLEVVRHERDGSGSRLEIQLLPEAFEPGPIAFWVFLGNRVELARHEAFQFFHDGAGQ